MTLIYFNVKYFMLKTLEEHKKLSFTHIMKHYKKGGTATPVTRNTTPVHPGEKQTLLLRYYPPADRKNFIIHKKILNFASCLSFCPIRILKIKYIVDFIVLWKKQTLLLRYILSSSWPKYLLISHKNILSLHAVRLKTFTEN